MITIVDIGLSNVGSVQNMLRKLNTQSVITSDNNVIAMAEKIILPGVGAFDHAMKKLENLGLRKTLLEKAESGTPILGICLGMQMLMESSEEGSMSGLGLIPGKVKKFTFEEKKLKIPHMGWNEIEWTKEHPLLNGLDEETDLRFYFVHSFFASPAQDEHILCKTHYGTEFATGIARKNVFGVQFHPEKSHRFGMRLLKNFVSL